MDDRSCAGGQGVSSVADEVFLGTYKGYDLYYWPPLLEFRVRPMVTAVPRDGSAWVRGRIINPAHCYENPDDPRVVAYHLARQRNLLPPDE